MSHHDTTVAANADSRNGRRVKPKHVLPKVGELERHYRRAAFFASHFSKSGHKPPPKKTELMASIRRGASTFGHLNRARNALHINDALKLTDALDVDVEDVFEIPEQLEIEVARHHQKRKEARERDFQSDRKKEMGAKPLPLTRRPMLSVVEDLRDAARYEVDPTLATSRNAKHFDDFGHVLEEARRLAQAGKLHAAASMISELVKGIHPSGSWDVLTGRYVERAMVDATSEDVYGEPDVEARRVLVLKLSQEAELQGHTVDRSRETHVPSNEERYSDEEVDLLSELFAWHGGSF